MSTTDNLLDNLNKADSIDSFIEGNKSHFWDMDKDKKDNIKDYLDKMYREYKITNIATIAENCGLDGNNYIYEIFNGKKNPGRDVLLRIALGFPLTLKETNRLLACGGVSQLYPRDVRDSVIIFCINNKDKFKDNLAYGCNKLLCEKKMEPLWRDEEKKEPVTGKQ